MQDKQLSISCHEIICHEKWKTTMILGKKEALGNYGYYWTISFKIVKDWLLLECVHAL